MGTTFNVIGPVGFASRSNAYVDLADVAEAVAVRVKYWRLAQSINKPESEYVRERLLPSVYFSCS